MFFDDGQISISVPVKGNIRTPTSIVFVPIELYCFQNVAKLLMEIVVYIGQFFKYTKLDFSVNLENLNFFYI